MNPVLIDSIGYAVLMIHLYSMGVKGEYKLRLISLIANVGYVLYGILISSTPLILGCIITVFLHGYHIKRLRTNRGNSD
ncbi:hypothetical protein [uncultured Croceitalea sp.]|uniref:hypothetical protein n=1 Tax=uncultured Croceitalea sp. TaxID=1798908 RepID=UPI0033060D84